MKKHHILSAFDMIPGKGLVWLSRPEDAVNDSEVLALAEARRFKADAIYFRRIETGTNFYSIPQVYIYEREFSDEDLVEVHTNLWSSGVVPLFYIVTDTRVKIFNCTKSVETKKGVRYSRPLMDFSFIGEIQNEIERGNFSARLLDNGTFWEVHKDILDMANSPYQLLLEGLLQAKKDIERRCLSLDPKTVNKLLIIGLLVRYLEEKEDENGVKLLEIGRDLYEKFPDCTRFTDVLRKGYIIPFLEELDLKFNGKLFDLSNAEREELAGADLDFAAAIFDANIAANTKQYILWDIYSFNHLPIELISGIYEAFLKKEAQGKNKGVVYTPPYLVNALIDECMPLDKAEQYFKNEEFRVLDPACGSGIFLVAALKRMVQWWAILHYKLTGRIEYPNIDTIQRITKRNIFGVDVEEGAALISIFSLSIALCDKLSPMQIWNELRFEDLRENNIRKVDFFEIFQELSNNRFDLVIGNPPFNPPSGYNNKSFVQHVKKHFQIEPSHPLNDDNLALFFWDRAVHLRNPGGKICFILPSGAWLYNNHSADYRKHFLQMFRVEKIYDFTHLSDRLFYGRTNVAVCATIASDMPEDPPANLLHIVVRRSKVAEERFYFELDHYDFYKVRYRAALEDPLVWKANLLGGGRLLRLLNYLGSLRSLGEYLEEKKKNGWAYAEGYIIANGDKTAEWITGKKTVDTDSFGESGIGKTHTEYAKYFYRSARANKSIFQPPHILIKENLGKERIPMVFSEEYLCFKDKIIGIHAPEKEKQSLKALYNRLQDNSSLNRFYVACISGQAGISMSNQVLLKTDIMNLPYPVNPDDLKLGYSETIVQNDVLQYHIKANSSSADNPLNRLVREDDLREYGEVFCNILNPIYKQNGLRWIAMGFHVGDRAIAYAFCYGKSGANNLPEVFEGGMEGVERLLQNNSRRNIRINRVLREYLHLEGYDVLLLVKPKAIRYWLKSIALRDADETFSDLKRTGF